MLPIPPTLIVYAFQFLFYFKEKISNYNSINLTYMVDQGVNERES